MTSIMRGSKLQPQRPTKPVNSFQVAPRVSITGERKRITYGAKGGEAGGMAEGKRKGMGRRRFGREDVYEEEDEEDDDIKQFLEHQVPGMFGRRDGKKKED